MFRVVSIDDEIGDVAFDDISRQYWACVPTVNKTMLCAELLCVHGDLCDISLEN